MAIWTFSFGQPPVTTAVNLPGVEDIGSATAAIQAALGVFADSLQNLAMTTTEAPNAPTISPDGTITRVDGTVIQAIDLYTGGGSLVTPGGDAVPDPATTEEPPDPFTELIGTAEGRQALFARELEPQLRGASGFLRRGLQRGFAPTEQAFLLQGALAQPENALNFAQFLPGLGTGTGRRIPTAGGIQTQIAELLQRLQLPMDDPNELVFGARTFAENPDRQFALALAGSQRFRQVLPFLRTGFRAEAGQRFEQRRLDAPGANFLTGFARRGFRF